MKYYVNFLTIFLSMLFLLSEHTLSQERREVREPDEVTIDTPELNIELKSREASLQNVPPEISSVIIPYSHPSDRLRKRGKTWGIPESGLTTQEGWRSEIPVFTWSDADLTHPHMTSDGDGNLYLVNQTQSNVFTEIDILRSGDGGKTWEWVDYIFFPAAFTSHDSLLVEQYVHNRIENRGVVEYESLLVKVREHTRIPIIIRLDVSFTPEGLLETAAAGVQRQNISNVQHALLSGMLELNISAVKRYRYVPYIAMQVDEQALLYLLESPYVVNIVVDKPVIVPALSESTPLVGADKAWSWGYTGHGYVIAILDTGVDINHPFFQGKIVDGACFSSSFPEWDIETLCPDGSEEQYGKEAGDACTSINGCSHGSHVAGIAAGSGTSSVRGNISGVAKDAQIISVQVFSRINDPDECAPNAAPCLRAFGQDVLSALEWIYEIRTTYNIASVNMSLGGGENTAPCDDSALKSYVDNLRSANIATIAASGNDGFTHALASPACISTVVSVGATLKTDAVWAGSNSTWFLDLLAPGVNIYSARLGGSFGLGTGTSMASPHVAGAWAVVREYNPGLNVAEILKLLSYTAEGVLDTRDNSIRNRIQVDRAVLAPGPHLPGVAYANGYLFIAYHRHTLENRIFRYNLSTGAGDFLTLPVPNTNIRRMRIISDADEFPGAWVYMAYIHENAAGNFEIYFTRTTNNGNSWSAPQNLGMTVPGYYKGILDVGLDWGSGGLFLSYLGAGLFENWLFVRKSGDFGSSWSSPVSLDGSVHGKSGPSVAVHDDNVLVVYQRRQINSSSIDDIAMGAYSVNAGETWTLFTIYDGLFQARMPRASHDGAGRFYVTYTERLGRVVARVSDGPHINTSTRQISFDSEANDGMFTALSGLKGDGNFGAAAAWSATVSDDDKYDIYGNSYGVVFPEIVVSPESFEEILQVGESISRILTVSNEGHGRLDFSVAPKVLLLTVDGWPEGAKDELIATGLFIDEDIDILNSPEDITLEFLMDYDAVLLYTNGFFNDPVHIGDVLKQYVDSGGSVVIATYAYTEGWGIEGGILDDEYSPFLPGPAQPVGGEIDMSTLTDPDHPIFKDIENAPEYWKNDFYSNPELNTGGVILASDINGNRIVAQNPSGRIVGINIYPGMLLEGNAESKLLFANALYFVHLPESWFSISPTTGTMGRGGLRELDVTFDAVDLQPGVYNRIIAVKSNDTENPVVTVPVELTVFDPFTSDTVEIQYTGGWEMVGLSVDVDDAHYQSLFSDAIENTLWAFSDGAYISADELEEDMGYWLRFSTAGNEQITGTIMQELGLSLSRGWNLISGISCPVSIADIDDPGGIITPGTLWGWSDGYEMSETIEPGSGYWINSNSEGVVVLSCTGAGESMVVLGDDMVKTGIIIGEETVGSSFHRLEFISKEGRMQELYFGGKLPVGVIPQRYDLPPVPPQGIFDVRFPDNRYLAEEKYVEILVQATDRHYPLSVGFEAANGNKNVRYLLREFQGDEVIGEHFIDTGSGPVLVNTGINRFELILYDEEPDLPREFYLMQNFPNPFNPVTTIRYQLPDPSDVQLEIYNMLGQRVRVLVNEVKEAGYHMVEWDGRNNSGQTVPSGIYIYRIQAGDFSAERMMIFLK